MNYLRNAEAGLVLTQDAVVTKNNGQIRIIPLKGMPDMVLNAAMLRDIADKYLPLVKPAISDLDNNLFRNCEAYSNVDFCPNPILLGALLQDCRDVRSGGQTECVRDGAARPVRGYMGFHRNAYPRLVLYLFCPVCGFDGLGRQRSREKPASLGGAHIRNPGVAVQV